MILASELKMSVRRCRSEVDSREFTDWKAFARMHPLGPMADLYRRDFMWEYSGPPQTPEEVEASIRESFGGMR